MPLTRDSVPLYQSTGNILHRSLGLGDTNLRVGWSVEGLRSRRGKSLKIPGFERMAAADDPSSSPNSPSRCAP